MGIITISITDERVKEIDTFVKKDIARDRSAFITQSVDLMIQTIKQKYVVDFMYFISIPLLFFLGVIGLTLYLESLFFYILSGISGIYLMIFFYLFYNKYKGVKNGNNR